MNYFYIFLIFYLSICNFSFAQNISLRTVYALPNLLNESSGIEISNSNKFWTHNDSGNDSKLYCIDTFGNIIKNIEVINVSNIDWEDLAQDAQGNFYIGDFGNNDNDRQDLAIYKIVNPDTISGNITTAQIINFTFSDQTQFPPPDSLKNFDMEGFFFFQDSLYLFSKNRSLPFSGFTKMYVLPSQPGNYIAKLRTQFFTSNSQLDGWITSADISPDGKKMILLSNSKAWLFSNFSGDDFFNGNVNVLNFNHLSQKEAIVFADSSNLFLSDELAFGIGGKLYQIDISGITSGLNEKTFLAGIKISEPFPNPSFNEFTIDYELPKKIQNAEIIFYNSIGKKIHFEKIKSFQKQIKLNKHWSSGIYFYRIESKNNFSLTKKIIIK